MQLQDSLQDAARSTVTKASSPDGLQKHMREALQIVFGAVRPRAFAVTVQDRPLLVPETSDAPGYTLRFDGPGGLRRFLTAGSEIGLAEAYIDGAFDIEGDVFAALSLRDHLVDWKPGVTQKLRLGHAIMHLPQTDAGERLRDRRGPCLTGDQHSKTRDRQAVSYHYDVSNEFYALWLDPGMVYSCAYFKEGCEADLDQAQRRKLDYICRKLRLRPGQRLLDIGCGWGSLMIHAAQYYGVEAVGVTLSENQARLANERFAAAGVADRCRVELRDYRDLGESQAFDRLVSVGMIEHVGRSQLPTYFQKAWSLLRPGGVFLNHGITTSALLPESDEETLIKKHVFPDAEMRPISVSLEVAEQVGFEVRDVESLREHYELTLREWVRRLDAARDEAIAATDEATYRIWRLYMAGSALAFREGKINVYQTLLVKPDTAGRSGLPLTRADWYGGDGCTCC